MANVFTKIAVVFKGGKIALQTADLATSIKVLRLNIASKFEAYRKANGNITQDMKSILRDVDRVTERAADIVDTVGLDRAETRLRDFIKPEMYK